MLLRRRYAFPHGLKRCFFWARKYSRPAPPQHPPLTHPFLVTLSRAFFLDRQKRTPVEYRAQSDSPSPGYLRIHGSHKWAPRWCYSGNADSESQRLVPNICDEKKHRIRYHLRLFFHHKSQARAATRSDSQGRSTAPTVAIERLSPPLSFQNSREFRPRNGPCGSTAGAVGTSSLTVLRTCAGRALAGSSPRLAVTPRGAPFRDKVAGTHLG